MLPRLLHRFHGAAAMRGQCRDVHNSRDNEAERRPRVRQSLGSDRSRGCRGICRFLSTFTGGLSGSGGGIYVAAGAGSVAAFVSVGAAAAVVVVSGVGSAGFAASAGLSAVFDFLERRKKDFSLSSASAGTPGMIAVGARGARKGVRSL